MEDITDTDQAYKKRVCKDFDIKNLGKYPYLYVRSNTLLSIDVFNNFWNMCLEIYGRDLAHFFSTPRLTWQAAFKRIKVKSVNYYSDIY